MSIAEGATPSEQLRTKTLLCMDLPGPILTAIGAASGQRVLVRNLSHLLMCPNQSDLTSADMVLLDVTGGGEDVISLARHVRSAVCASGSASPILCFSSTHHSARFVVELTSCGVRYVRISDPAMLLDSIELLLAELAYIDLAGPSFCVRHRFSRGSCAPGEEIEAIELIHHGEFFQLLLSLSGRFTFNCLAETRSIALDAFQISSRLGGWFYREHAGNSGMKQTIKVRVATVKVLALRIRQAMAAAFAKAGLALDPYDVLRSYSAEGSNRKLYRLRADIRWEHLPG